MTPAAHERMSSKTFSGTGIAVVSRSTDTTGIELAEFQQLLDLRHDRPLLAVGNENVVGFRIGMLPMAARVWESAAQADLHRLGSSSRAGHLPVGLASPPAREHLASPD